jgi:ATP-dependent helicase/nuclease subunit A
MSHFTPSQKEAIAARGNVLVVAGAGTGKTSTLVQRCLALLEEGASLESILMVTFTDAAAAEMRHRIRDALQERLRALDGTAGGNSNDDPGACLKTPQSIVAAEVTRLQYLGDPPRDTEDVRASSRRRLQVEQDLRVHFEKQLALLDMASISTLHSFCLQLVREHFYELSIDPEVTVLDEQQTGPLVRQTLDALLERHFASDTESDRAVQSLVRVQGRGSDDRIRALILKLHRYTQSLANPDRWLEEQRALFRQPDPARWREWFVEGFVDWRALWRPALASQVATPAILLSSKALESAPEHPSVAEVADAVQAIIAVDGNDETWPRGSKTAVRSQFKNFFTEAEFLGSLTPAEGSDPLAEDWELIRHPSAALLDLTREFTADFSRAKHDLGGVDFPDLEQFALRLLRDPRTDELTPLARTWQTRLHHLFVDEYQDINAAQDAILTALSRDGAESNRFLVGDVKQSIYRFRLADPAIFRGYERRWGGGAVHARRISLLDNFRSREGVLDFVNGLFDALMREEIGGVPYEPLRFGNPAESLLENSVPGGAGDPPIPSGDSPDGMTSASVTYLDAGFPAVASSIPVGGSPTGAGGSPAPPIFWTGSKEQEEAPRVEFHLIAKGEETKGGNEAGDGQAEESADVSDLLATEREARLVALRLRELHCQRHEIWDKNEKQFRPVRWNDMVVLLRSPAGRVEAFAKEFNTVGVPLEAARGGFFQSTEISDLLCLLKLIDNPLQDIPLLAVLRSPLAGLSVDELAELRAHNREPSFWETLRRFHSTKRGTDEDEASASVVWRKVDLFLRQFETWRGLIRQTSLSHCLETALSETCYEELLLTELRGETRVANVRRLLDLARQYDPYQRQGLFRFLRFVATQETLEADLEPASARADDAVRLMSIHKSKGLEFPVVVMAGMGGLFNTRDLHEDILLDENYGLCPKVAPPEGEQRYPSLPHWLANRRQRRELLGEELRLLYVAMTRARDTLILTATSTSKEDPKWDSTGPRALSQQEMLSARSYLDWLQLWLLQATRATDWSNEREGQSDLLRWTIYSQDDPRLARPSNQPPGESRAAIELAPSALDQLRERVTWSYPFAAAAEERAKTNVTELRRRQVEEDEESQAAPFIRRSNRLPRTRPPDGGLTAAEAGTAHHRFLERVDLSRTGSVLELKKEAERLSQAMLLSAVEAAILDLEALEKFWQSDVGADIRAQAEHVQREMPFTARFSPADLAAAHLPANTQLPADEFVVVQGVVDLAVILPQEIWILDFKTDRVNAASLPEKVRTYEPQLKLYALALSRIYRRPVTQGWLHFLTLSRTVPCIPP